MWCPDQFNGEGAIVGRIGGESLLTMIDSVESKVELIASGI